MRMMMMMMMMMIDAIRLDGVERDIEVPERNIFRKRYLHPKCTTAARKMNTMMMMMMMKAKIWSAMDWYQTTIRSSAGLSWHAFVAQNMGGALSLELSKHYEGRLKLSLDVLETKWLGDSSPFLNERPHPSIADLLVVEDIVNLVVLKGSPFRSQLSSLEELLRTRPRIRKWIDAVSRLNRPAWDELHRVPRNGRGNCREENE